MALLLTFRWDRDLHSAKVAHAYLYLDGRVYCSEKGKKRLSSNIWFSLVWFDVFI